MFFTLDSRVHTRERNVQEDFPFFDLSLISIYTPSITYCPTYKRTLSFVIALIPQTENQYCLWSPTAVLFASTYIETLCPQHLQSMKNQSKPIFIAGYLVYAILFSHYPSTRSQEVGNAIRACPLFSLLLFPLFFLVSYLTSYSLHGAENEREFDYVEGSEKGPRHWGDIRKDWTACKNGGMQSPIDLSSQRVKLISKSGQLKRNYKSCNATVKNRGHDISVRNQSSQTLWTL